MTACHCSHRHNQLLVSSIKPHKSSHSPPRCLSGLQVAACLTSGPQRSGLILKLHPSKASVGPAVHMDCWYSGPQASLLSWGKSAGLVSSNIRGDNGSRYMRGGDERLEVGAVKQLLRKVSRMFQIHQSWWII